MPSIRLTKTAVERLPAPDPSGKQTLWWDSEKHGLGVLCSGVSNAKSWVCQIGKSKRYTIGPVNVLDPGEAWERAKPLIADIYAGKDPKAERKRAARASVTLADVLESYLTQPRLSPRSVIAYRNLATRHLAPWLDRPLRSLTAEDVEARFAAISKEVVATRAKGLSRGGVKVTGEASANGAMTLVRSLWNYQAEHDETLPRSPTGRLKKQWHKLERRKRRVWEDDLPGFYRAVMALPNLIARDVVRLGLFTGMREGEVIGLRWEEEVDLRHKLIRLPKTRMKAKQAFELPMSSHVHDLLVAVRARGIEGPYVFPGNGPAKHTRSFSYAMELVSQSIGTKVSPHDLRRTYASIAATCAIPGHALKLLLAHAVDSGDVTAGYINLSVEDLRRCAQTVTDKIAALCGIEVPEADNVKRMG